MGRWRPKQAILAVVMEAYLNAVSTRKVDPLVEQLGVQGMSRDRVSALCGALDEQVAAFQGASALGRLPLPLAGRQAGECQRPQACGSKAIVVAISAA